MPQYLTDDKSTLVHVMAWCSQATSHYLNQYWPRSPTPYDVTSPQWVKYRYDMNSWKSIVKLQEIDDLLWLIWIISQENYEKRSASPILNTSNKVNAQFYCALFCCDDDSPVIVKVMGNIFWYLWPIKKKEKCGPHAYFCRDVLDICARSFMLLTHGQIASISQTTFWNAKCMIFAYELTEICS